jgi:hypothetical protein
VATTSPEDVYLQGLRGIQPPPPPEKGTKIISTRSILAHHDAHPFALDVLLLKVFGPSYYEWESSVVWAELERMFSSTISELSKNKIEAMRTLHLCQWPWENWETFEKVIQALNNNVPRFDIMQKCTLSQLWNGVKIMNMARRERFTGDVPKYVAAVFMTEGVSHCPPPLNFAAPLFKQRASVRKAWQSWAPGKHLGETVEGIQVARLLVAKQYVSMRDSQLKQQLEFVQRVPAAN